jgi:hypothetical protein
MIEEILEKKKEENNNLGAPVAWRGLTQHRRTAAVVFIAWQCAIGGIFIGGVDGNDALAA